MLGNSAADSRTSPPVSPNAACIRPMDAVGWNTTWSAANPVSAETASRTRPSSWRSRSTVPNRERERISYCPAASASAVAEIGPTRP